LKIQDYLISNMKATLYTFGLLALALLFGAEALAQGAITVEPLTDIGVETGNQENIGSFVNQLYQYGVGLGAILAVLIIMYGGFRYMTSEAVGEKSAGREDIQRAILGLLLLLSPVIVFGVINQDILNLNFNLDNLDPDKYGRNPIDNGVGGPGGVEGTISAACTDVAWRGNKQNVIGPERDGHLPTVEDMSHTELARCCSSTEGLLDSRRVRADGGTHNEVFCDQRTINIAVKADIYLDNELGTVIQGAAINITGRVKAGLCNQIDENANSTWADNKVTELLHAGILELMPTTRTRVGDSIVERLEIVGGSGGVRCGLF
tara:strand:- start:2080 stop:3039 length:960 start_codon:yes stop_codon:yes gene_type:complete